MCDRVIEATGAARRGSMFLALAPIATLALILSGCGDDAPPANEASTPPAVTVAQPVVREVRDWDEYTGRFSAVDQVEVRARVSGYLDDIHFQDGQTVEKGALLFTIDQRPFELAVIQAEADVAAAKARLALAEKEVERATPLVERGNLSQSVFDQRIQERDAARATVMRSEAALRTAKLNLEFTQIRAPVAGRISRHLVTKGNLVTGGTATATLLTTIVSLDPIYFYFEADEAAYLRYVRLARSGERPSSREVRNPVRLKLADETRYRHTGRMDFVENRLDTRSGTITGRAVFQNSDFLFTPGMFARMRLLASGTYQALMVPDEVVGTDQSRRFVYVVATDGTVRLQIVTLGRLIDGLRVIKTGLSPDDRVVIKGLQRARPGSKVTAQPGQITTRKPDADTEPEAEPRPSSGDKTHEPAE